jgi:hypothetical protein
MQAQQAIALPRRSYSIAIAVVATLVASLLAFALVANVERPATSSTTSVVTLHGVGSEQIAHNRSEQGFDGYGSVGGEQVAHDRSEQGLTNP